MPKKQHPSKTHEKTLLAQQMSVAGKLSNDGGLKRVLHIEVGPTKTALHAHFNTKEWKVFTLNIDKKTPADFHLHPGNLSIIPDETFDAVWSNHSLKFFYTNEIPKILKECLRVLKKDGLFTMGAHNLKRIIEIIRIKGLEGAVYETPAGPVNGLDILYGFHKFLQGENKPFVAPKTGFSTSHLGNLLTRAGFRNITLVEEGISVSASAYKRANHTEANGKVKITSLDLNALMLERDKMDVPPTNAFPEVEKK